MRKYRTGNVAVNIKCPYYRATGDKYIECEGPVNETKNKMMFQSVKKRHDFQEKNCFKCKNLCPIADAIEKKYENEKGVI